MSEDFLLDTSALATLQRDNARFLALLRLAREDGRMLRTCAPVITEFLGHSPRRLRARGEYVISHVTPSEVPARLARRAAALIQATLDAGGGARPSVIDALLAAEGEATYAAVVFDGDRRDFTALAHASGGLEIAGLTDLL